MPKVDFGRHTGQRIVAYLAIERCFLVESRNETDWCLEIRRSKLIQATIFLVLVVAIRLLIRGRLSATTGEGRRECGFGS